MYRFLFWRLKIKSRNYCECPTPIACLGPYEKRKINQSGFNIFTVSLICVAYDEVLTHKLPRYVLRNGA